MSLSTAVRTTELLLDISSRSSLFPSMSVYNDIVEVILASSYTLIEHSNMLAAGEENAGLPNWLVPVGADILQKP